MNPHADDVAIIRGSETISSLTVKQAVMSACGPLDRIRTTAVKRVCRGYFPLIHRFFRGFGVTLTEVPSHTGRTGEGGA
jgi:hypothetical protein